MTSTFAERATKPKEEYMEGNYRNTPFRPRICIRCKNITFRAVEFHSKKETFGFMCLVCILEWYEAGMPGRYS